MYDPETMARDRDNKVRKNRRHGQNEGRVGAGLRPIRSVRGYRRRLDEFVAKALRGEVPWSAVTPMTRATQESIAALTAEHLLGFAGGDQEAQEHPLGDQGGAEPIGATRTHRKQKVTVKRGYDRRGIPTDETSVSIEGDDEDEGMVEDAEIAALM